MNHHKQEVFFSIGYRLIVGIYCCFAHISVIHGQNADIPVNFDNYDKSCGISISADKRLIIAQWEGNGKTNYVEFRVEAFLDEKWIRPQPPLIQSIGVIEDQRHKEIFREL